MKRPRIDELKISIRLGFWGLTLIVACFVINIVWMALDPLGGWAGTLMVTLFGLVFVLMLVVSILAAYRLSRAHGDNLAVRIVYCALMLLPIGNFIFLWGLRDRGIEKQAELAYLEFKEELPASGRPDPSLGELVATALSKPESKATYGRFARSTLLTLGISGALGAWMLAVFLISPDEYYHLLSGLLGAITGAVVLAALIKVAAEAFSASPQDRTTPERAVESYMNMVSQERWPEAMSCLSWIACRGEAVVRPAIPDIDLSAAVFRIRQSNDLGGYWRDLGRGRKLSGARSMSCEVLGVDYSTKSSATVRVKFSMGLDLATAEIGGEVWKRSPAAVVQAAEGLGLASSDKEVCFPWPVYFRNSRWHLLQVGFSSIRDNR